MRARQGWTIESLGRALDIHQAHGVVKEWSPPEAGRAKWQVHIKGNLTYFEWTSPQVHAFCVGCAEAYERGRQAGFVEGVPAGGALVGRDVTVAP